MKIHPNVDDFDTNTGLPRKLGWKVALWALGALEAIAIGMIMHLNHNVEEQGKHIANIEGRLGFGSKTISVTNAIVYYYPFPPQ